MMIAMPIVILLVLGVIAFVRSAYFEAEVNQKVIGISISPTQLTIIFIIINVAMFLGAVIVSYESAHPNKNDFKSIVKRYKTALRNLHKEAAEAKDAGRAFAKAEMRLQQIRQRRLKSYEHFVQTIKTIVDSGEWLVSAYRAANLREQKDIPPCLKNAPQTPQISEDLLQLDWNCGQLRTGNQS